MFKKYQNTTFYYKSEPVKENFIVGIMFIYIHIYICTYEFMFVFSDPDVFNKGIIYIFNNNIMGICILYIHTCVSSMDFFLGNILSTAVVKF